ncbi:autotransporter outer membrane beta-barrel domain-containing protein [Microvirga sp. W0021]|uniref:Autotransporter outer membrane beta-barrel domain-containing protein n=1 Tax=Hohaiivirga grylli TaxID=3133970 RepID=A0ABV0BGQ0_9HYPH
MSKKCYGNAVRTSRAYSYKSCLIAGTALASLFLINNTAPNAATLDCNSTLYYCNPSSYDIVNVITTESGTTAPLQGFGVYMKDAQYNLKEINISTTGSAADGVRINSEANYFYADRLTIKTTGSSADGINAASDFNRDYDSLVYIGQFANIETTNGIAVRANNYQNAGSNTVIILPDASVIKVIGTATATNANDGTGYAVYAGNRNKDTNGLTGWDLIFGNNNTLGSSYVFIGNNATIETSTITGHAVYANKGGFIQLGDGADIKTTGTNAYALYAATEQQGTYTDNVRPGYIYLAGGATLRATNTAIVMQANGADSVIANRSINTPVIPDNFQRYERLPAIDKSSFTETSGKFDVTGIMDAINGGVIALNMSDGSIFVGSTDIHIAAATPSNIDLKIDGSTSKWQINADSSLTSLNLSSGATLEPYRAAGESTSFTLTGTVTNGGAIDLSKELAAGDVFTINGNYIGNNGRVVLNTLLNEGGSLANQSTDRLLINGNVTGTTNVSINLVTGSIGRATASGLVNLPSEGISIIQVSGSASENSFSLLGGYITAGGTPYQYTLQAYGPGASNGAANESQRLVTGTNPYWDYRLQSAYISTPVTPDPEPEIPGIIDPEPPAPTPDPGPTPQVRAVAPQVANYILAPTALFHAGLMDISNLHRRLGEVRDDRALGRNSGTGEFFIRAYGGTYRYNSNRNTYSYGYNADINYAAVQMGGNLFAFEGEESVTRFGIAGSIGKLTFGPNRVSGTTDTDLDKWTVSAYATYLHNSGWYIDGILSYGGFDGHVSTSYRGRTAGLSGKTFAASIETGYPIKLTESIILEPQAQLVYQRLMFDRKLDVDNFVVTLGNLDQLTARIGARLSKTYTEKDRIVTVYGKLNLIHNFRNHSNKIYLGDDFRIGQLGTVIEAGVGINTNLSKNLSAYGDIAYQQRIGKTGVSGFSLTGGLRYTF